MGTAEGVSPAGQLSISGVQNNTLLFRRADIANGERQLTNEYWGKAKWDNGTEFSAKAEDPAFESGSQVQVQTLPLTCKTQNLLPHSVGHSLPM